MLLETYYRRWQGVGLDAAIHRGCEEGLTPSEDTEDGATSATVDRSNLLRLKEAKGAPKLPWKTGGETESSKDFSSNERRLSQNPPYDARLP